MLNIIQRFVQVQGWKFGRLDGNTNVASRQRLVDSFNSDDSYFVMLMTTRTGGIGLNLTGASRVILYDPGMFMEFFSGTLVFYSRSNLALMLVV
jgi:DNA excision repair protein ERCC-6